VLIIRAAPYERNFTIFPTMNRILLRKIEKGVVLVMSDSVYSTTGPATLAPGPEPVQATRPLAEVLNAEEEAQAQNEHAGYTLAGLIGAQLTEPLSVVQRTLNAYVAAGTLTPLQAQPIIDAIEDAGKLAIQSQLLTKVVTGRARHVHEQLDLNRVVNQVLDEHAHSLRVRGVELHRNTKPVAVIVNPELVAALIDAAIDWSGEHGQRMVVSLEVKNWPQHAMLKLKTNQTVMTTDQPVISEKLSWHLIVELSRAIGATVDRAQSPTETLLSIEFPRTVQLLDGLTAMEMDVGSSSWMHTAANVMAGHRVLIVSSDIKLRDDAKLVCRTLGLVVDSVPTSAMAVRFCEMEKPELIIIDERFNDGTFDELRTDLLRIQPNFPFIEVAYDSDTLSMSGWMGDNMTRVNRESLVAQLPQALAIEMSTVL